MGGIRISNTEGLPKEFSLDKYEACASLSLRDWLLMLEMRAFAIFQLRFERQHKYPLNAKEFVGRLLREPLWPLQLELDGTGLRKHFDSTSVCDLEVWYYFCAELDMEDKEKAAYVDAHKKFNAEPIVKLTPQERALLDEPVWKMYQSTGIDPGGEVMARVNLDCTEEKAIDDFRAWFRKTKQALGMQLRSKKITAREAQGWVTNAVLPYIDIYLWALAEEVEITWQLYGITLFPTEHNVALSERMRKVVAPLAKSLVSEEFCEILRAQVLGDLRREEGVSK